MNRVVVTGMGIVSSLGVNKSEVLESLKLAKSGIEFSEKYIRLYEQVTGQTFIKPNLDISVRDRIHANLAKALPSYF